MTARKQYPRGQHPYGRLYRLDRAAILGPSGGGDLPTDPPCHWNGPRCTGVGVTADHDPPIEVAGPHRQLVPSCKPCNYGRHGKNLPLRKTYPAPSRAW